MVFKLNIVNIIFPCINIDLILSLMAHVEGCPSCIDDAYIIQYFFMDIKATFVSRFQVKRLCVSHWGKDIIFILNNKTKSFL